MSEAAPSPTPQVIADANTYHHTRKVALANGFESISHAITVASAAVEGPGALKAVLEQFAKARSRDEQHR